MAMTRNDFRKQLQEGLNAVFGMEYKRYPEEWREIFDIERSMKAFEEDVLLAGFAGAPVKPEGEGVAYDEGAESYVARYTHETIALVIGPHGSNPDAITHRIAGNTLWSQSAAKLAREGSTTRAQARTAKWLEVVRLHGAVE